MTRGEILVEIQKAIAEKATKLDLSKKDIREELPSEIGQLHHLKELDLSDNYVLKLPMEIGQLRSLTSLNLFQSYVPFLPPENCKNYQQR
jgi:Leucine-rich repeat (LRR) protein